MRVVVDTNVFFSSFYGGNPRKVIDLWKKGHIILCLSGPVLDKYLEVLDRAFAGEPERDDLAALLEGGFHSIFTARPVSLSIANLDPDDVKFIECAESLSAEWIVTGDRELQHLEKYGRISIGSPKRFLQEFYRLANGQDIPS